MIMKKVTNLLTFSIILSAVYSIVFVSSFVFAQSTDPLNNPSFEQAGATAQTAYDWQNFGNGYTRVSTAHTGAWGIRLQNSNFSQQSGAYQRIDLKQTTLKPVFISSFIRGQSIVNSSGGFVGASIYAEIIMNDGSVAYWNSIANSGTFNWRWIGFNTGTVANVNKPIDHIFIVPILANAAGTAYFDDIRVEEKEPTQGAVTIMIDDGEDAAFTQAKPVMDNYGFKGTIAMISEMVDEEGFLSTSQLKSLQSAGWEIVSHSIDHEDMTKMTSLRQTREFTQSKSELQAISLTISNFAFPFGAYNASLLANGAQYYRSLRAFEQGDNPQGVFPYDVKVRGVLDSTSPDQVNAWIQDAKNNKRWVVLTFHTISATGDDAYHTSPSAFADMMAKVSQSGIPVITYNQGISQFGSSR